MNRDRHCVYTLYLYSVSLFGAAVLISSILAVGHADVSYYWVAIAILTLLTSAFPIKIPEIDFKISIEDTFFFTNLLLFGLDVGVVTAAIQGLMGSLRAKSVRRRPEFAIFNIGAHSVCAWISGRIFFALYGNGPMFGAHNVSFLQIITPAAALAAVQFLLNTGGVAIIVALDSRKSVYQVWRRNLSWTAVAYLSGASVAALIAVSANSFSLGVIAAAAPILLITHVMYNTYREKVQNHITELQELNNLYMRTVESLALAVDAKDRSTHGHIRRVRAFALGLAKLRGVTDADEILGIETAALLHDIGKLAIEDFILNKPGRLSSQEFERMKIHTLAGEEIIQQIQFPFPVAEYVRSHHEHWDGTGYPLGLKGDQIPLGARILAVADSYDAIRSSRPYKASRGVHEAATIVRRDAGTAFDPVLAELFVQNIEQLEKGASAAARLTKELTFRDRTRSDAISPPAALPEINPAALSCDLFALHQFCSCAAHTLELEELLPIVARRIAGLIPYASCAFFLLTSDNTLEVPYAAGECKELFEKAKIAVGLGISGWVAAYRRPMLNVAARLEFNDPDPTLFELQDALVVPLAIGEEAIGTVSLYGAKAGSYSEHDCATLQAVARIAAPAIADARLRAHSPSDRRRDIVTENHCVANISLG